MLPYLLAKTKNYMKKLKILSAFIIIGSILFILIGGKRLFDYYSLAEERYTIYHTNRIIEDDTIRVIMIGDSWAAYHHDNDTILATMLQEKLHKPVHVISSGMVGAKTKAIYELMFDSISPIGTLDIIKRHPDYCIISAGINDAVAKMGAKNYCYHYGLIIKTLISSGVTPIIIDMPNVGFYSVYKREPFFIKIRHRISSLINRTDMWNFEEYRNAIDTYIKENRLTNQIIYIAADSWNQQGFKDIRQLYLTDDIHLNRKGYFLLDSCIAERISSHMVSP